MRAFGIDTSANNTVNWDIVAPNIDFAWSRSSSGTNYKDPTFPDNCQAVYDHGKPFGSYHYGKFSYYTQFPFPTNDDYSRWPAPVDDHQFSNFLDTQRFKAVSMIALDLEEYYNEGISSAWYSAAAKFLAGRMFDYAESKGIKFFIYSRNTFILERVPELNNWIGRYNSWIAQWRDMPGNGAHFTWDEIRALAPQEPLKPGYFSNRPNWEMWQYSGEDAYIPGHTGRADLNVYNGTPAQLYEWLNFTPAEPAPEPEPDPEPVGITLAVKDYVRVRSTPVALSDLSNVVGQLAPGEVLYTNLIKGAAHYWIKHSQGWSATGPLNNPWAWLEPKA